jgi:4-cresol dehydrogenase (hydroxylating)
MENLNQAIRAWQDVIGSHNVITEATALNAAQTATFMTTSTIPAMLRPADRREVQACVQVANRYKIPIYPISRGKNWGYGSRTPVQSGCVMLDLGRLNQIIDFNEELGYITLEPGVTQQQVYEYLRDRHSNLYMGMTGSVPDSSVIGNAIERGVGKGSYGDRFDHVCGMEVILPTGECIHTGFGRFANAKATPVHRWGVGPFCDGLFTQSNLGIVTQMTFWLLPQPAFFQLCWYTLEDDTKLETLIDTLRNLMLKQIIQPTFVISNDYRMFSYMQQYPWDATAGQTPLPFDLRQSLRQKWDTGAWYGELALTAPTGEQGQITQHLLKQALAGQANQMFFLDDTIAQLPMEALQQLYPGVDVNGLLHWYKFDPQRGIPTKGALGMAYWRKQTPQPQISDLDQDRCGLFWCAPTLPAHGRTVCEVLQLIDNIVQQHGFEPSIGLNFISARSLYITIAIVYDRESPGEDERALACYQTLMQQLTQSGHLPYRISNHSMNSLPLAQDDYGKLLSTLKQALDPNDILAPGHYDFRNDWPNSTKPDSTKKEQMKW